ncbi:MAG: phage major capsid protein [Pseudomonadota bacterium]
MPDSAARESNQRAYSILHVKNTDDKQKRIIEGIATTPTPDRMLDVVEPLGARFAQTIPLLWQHDHSAPVGEVRLGRSTKDGIPFKATFNYPKPDYPKEMADEINRAWVSVRDGLVKAVSIGFNGTASRMNDKGGFVFDDYEIVELSLVTIPANPDANINQIRSVDRKMRAALGNASTTDKTPARAWAQTKKSFQRKSKMTTVSERISALEADENRILSAIKSIDVDNLDEDQEDKFDELEAELAGVRKMLRIARVQDNVTAKEKAKPVEQKKSSDKPETKITNVRPNDNIPPGIPFARKALCLYHANGNALLASQIAEKYYPDDARIAQSLMFQKAAVDGGWTGDDAGWANTIAEPNTIGTEFIDFLRPRTIIDQLASRMRRVPFNVKVPRMTTDVGGAWFGEGNAVPVSAGAFDTVTVEHTKVGGLAILTKEQMRLSHINAEQAVRDALAGVVINTVDTKLVSADARVAGVSPAGLLNGVSGIASVGDTADNARTDLMNLFEGFSAADISENTLDYVTTENIRKSLRLLKSSLGVYEFPELREDGNLDGRPLTASNSVAGGNLIAISSQNILLADDGNVDVEFSDQASVQMDDAPTMSGRDGTGAAVVSLFQTEMVGMKVTREINFVKARPAAVQLITGATYLGAAS